MEVHACLAYKKCKRNGPVGAVVSNNPSYNLSHHIKARIIFTYSIKYQEGHVALLQRPYL